MTVLLRAVIFLASAAAGILLAGVLVPGFHITWRDWWGFVLAIVLFAIVQSIVAPIAMRLARRRAPLLLGGIGIIATFVSIVVVVLIPGAGMGISTLGAWFLTPLVVWIVSAVATWLLTTLLLARSPKRTDAATSR